MNVKFLEEIWKEPMSEWCLGLAALQFFPFLFGKDSWSLISRDSRTVPSTPVGRSTRCQIPDDPYRSCPKSALPLLTQNIGMAPRFNCGHTWRSHKPEIGTGSKDHPNRENLFPVLQMSLKKKIFYTITNSSFWFKYTGPYHTIPLIQGKSV